MRNAGFFDWPSSDAVLLELTIITPEGRSSYFNVSDLDLEEICSEYDIPFDEFHKSISDAVRKKAHTVLVDLPVYLASLEKPTNRAIAYYDNRYCHLVHDEESVVAEYVNDRPAQHYFFLEVPD